CESDALMLSGYLATKQEFDASVQHFPVSAEPGPDWRFRKIEKIATAAAPGAKTKELIAALEIAANIPFKPWIASSGLKGVTALIIIALLVWAGGHLWLLRDAAMPALKMSVGAFSAIAGGILLGLAALHTILTRFRFRNSVMRVAVAVLM